MTTETRRRPAPTDGMDLAERDPAERDPAERGPAEHGICAMTGVLSLVDGASPA